MVFNFVVLSLITTLLRTTWDELYETWQKDFIMTHNVANCELSS